MAVHSEAQTSTPPGTPRGAGSPRPGGTFQARAGGAEVLTPEELQQIGETLGSRIHWQADVARQVDYSKYAMTRFLNGSRNINPLLAQLLHGAMVEKIEAVAALFAIQGLPGACDSQTDQGLALITQGLELLRKAAKDDPVTEEGVLALVSENLKDDRDC